MAPPLEDSTLRRTDGHLRKSSRAGGEFVHGCRFVVNRQRVSRYNKGSAENESRLRAGLVRADVPNPRSEDTVDVVGEFAGQRSAGASVSCARVRRCQMNVADGGVDERERPACA